MKNLRTEVVRVNGQYDVYADRNTVRYQSYADLAAEMGKDWGNMNKRQKSNFRRENASRIKPIPTRIEVYLIEAIVPNIFGEHQLKQAAIDHLIHPGRGTIFLECKNGVSGWSTTNFKISKGEDKN
jgi:hypothetical protein